jgi:hypothetical protein
MSASTLRANPRFRVGDTVARPINVFKSGSPVRIGTVTRVYSESGTQFGDYPELYEVTWTIERGKPIEPLVCTGYLRHGLDPLP